MQNNGPDAYENTGFGLYTFKADRPLNYKSLFVNNVFRIRYYASKYQPITVLVSNRSASVKDYEVVISKADPDEHGQEYDAILLANVPPGKALFSDSLLLNFGTRELTCTINSIDNVNDTNRLLFYAPITVTDYPTNYKTNFYPNPTVPRIYKEYVPLVL